VFADDSGCAAHPTPGNGCAATLADPALTTFEKTMCRVPLVRLKLS